MINKTFPIIEKLFQNGLNLNLNLLDLLSNEAESLKNRAHSNTISTIAVNKKEIVFQLEQFTKQISQVLATEKLQLTPVGIADYFQKAEKANLNTTISNGYWNEIISISRQCRTLNEKNGACINLLSQHTQRALHILKGKSQRLTTYGPDGSTQSERFSHSLVSV